MQKNEKSNILENPFWSIFPVVLFLFLVSIYFNRFNLDFLTEGDLGRDLYKYYLVSDGQLPYIDFNWIYGPLSPFLYGFVFKVFGVSVLNAAVLWYLFYFLCMAGIFYIVKSFSNYFYASIASLFFLAYYGMTIITFNHILGTLLIILLLLFLKLYLSSFKANYLYWVSIASFLLLYTKINMGLALVIPVYAVLLIFNFINKKDQKDIIKSIILCVFLSFIGYFVLIAFSPVDQLGKSFPYFNSNMMSGRMLDFNSLLSADAGSVVFKFIKSKLLFKIFYVSSLNILYVIAIIISLIYLFYYYRKNKFDDKFAFMLVLIISSVFCMNEFILVSTFYSLRYWVLTQIIILLAFIIYNIQSYLADTKMLKSVSFLIVILFIIPLSVKLYAASLYVNLPSVKTNYERLGISVYDKNWYENLNNISSNLKNTLNKDDSFLAVPYNSIYNFILKKEVPSRIDEFMLLSGVNNEDEMQVIKYIEANDVKVILYNPFLEKTLGVGSFGETHCKILFRYINQNYIVDKILKPSPASAPFVILRRSSPFASNS